MSGEGPFDALSLDLWFTSFYHTDEDLAAWDAARVRTLEQRLRLLSGKGLDARTIADAVHAVSSGLRSPDQTVYRSSVTSDPSLVLRALADHLHAVVVGTGDAAEELSAAGLSSAPPRINPEADRLVRRLAARGIPTVLLTNSSRRSSTWSAFLDRAGGPPFRAVVSSADFGRAKPDPEIFREAARRLSVRPEHLLHVGDRWELDVEGALAAGCGAALYRGLWDRYPETYSELPPPPSDTGAVRLVDDLSVLADPELWTS